MKDERIVTETLPRLFRKAAEHFGDLPAFAPRLSTGDYESVSFQTIFERGMDLATGLIDLGLGAREHVGLLADNCLEWILSDYAIQIAGAADVPRGTDVTDEEIAYILGHSDARFVILENEAVLAKFLRVWERVPRIQCALIMRSRGDLPQGVLPLGDVEKRGCQLRAAGDMRAAERLEGVRGGDLFTIIYTSGTTGTPKGVQLTHENMTSQVRNLPFSLFPGERALSILPIWHSYERVFEMVAISMGVCTYYTGLRTIAEDLKTVRPQIMASAPRLWEGLYQKLMARVEKAPPLRRALFAAAKTASCRVNGALRFFRGCELDTTGRSLPEKAVRAVGHAANLGFFFLPYRLLDPLVLARLREAVGCSHFRGTISGGGALQPHVDEFFNAIGIPVLEGYGLTETSPVLAVRTWERLVIGTVGPLFPETEVRIVDLQTGGVLFPDASHRAGGRGLRGEIHVRGPQVMPGYYKSPELTARVLRDGWFNTGDIGMVTFNNCLKILGRSKETIVLRNGENVEPVPIESRLVASPLVDNCIVTGQDQKSLGALIVPSLDGFRQIGVQAANLTELAQNEEARPLMDAEIRRLIGAQTGFKPFERVTCFRLIGKPFEVGDELTNTFKLKRHVLGDKYAHLLREMHEA